MKKKNQLIKRVSLCIAMAMVLTVGIMAKTKTEAQAGLFDWFDRISVDKCAISLVQDEFKWTGEAFKPEVRVNYKGQDLEKNVDYLVSYKDNVDAGRGRVIIEGKGEYRGKSTVYFKINGIDIEKECIANINNDIVEVYYKGQLLKNKQDYWYNVLKQEILQESIPSNQGYINTYKVTYYYTISGKGKFEGIISKNIVTTETKLEDITFTKE